MSNHLARAHPDLDRALGTLELADLPTPVSAHDLTVASNVHCVSIKHDDVTGSAYGGNKVRKLEYVFERARQRGAKRVATFGSIGSNHAVATALYATRAGFDCTCLLAHQSLKPGLGKALRFHQQNDTEIIKWGGPREDRVAIMRRAVQGRRCWVIPLGGSSWLGNLGFVNAGLELAAQIDAGSIPRPARVYVALGTMGTVAGLALGFALAGLDIDVHAVRVTEEQFANEAALKRLMEKTATLMHRFDPTIPANLADSTRVVCRHEFFGPGYGRTDDTTDAAVASASDLLGLTLDTTYSGKTMAALLADLPGSSGEPVLFWNTYNSRPLDVDDTMPIDVSKTPEEFSRYFD
ncbi:MAG: pyridoxal-phosphate dependent enzyme [Pseudomonadota bacterium]